MIKIINKVPHPVVVLDEDNKHVRTFPKSNGMVRLAQTTKVVGKLDGIPVTHTVFGEPEQLPPEKEDVYYIVSQLVKIALPNRKDLLVPSNVIRDNSGMIIGCKSLEIVK